MKKIRFILLILICVILCGLNFENKNNEYAAETTGNVSVTGVSLNQTSVTLTSIGETVQLTATVSPSNATDRSVTWKSSDNTVAIVSTDGLVTAVGSGNATITVTTVSGKKTATCKITVNIATTGITLDKTSITLTAKDDLEQLTATVTPNEATNKLVTWKSSDTSVATVSSSGLVSPVGNGTATITATTKSGNQTATCTVNVAYAVTGIKLDITSATLNAKGETITLTPTLLPSNAANKKIIWKSSDTSVATVSDKGVVTAVGNGTATITAETESGGYKATCKVMVSITLNTPVLKYVTNQTNGVKISWNVVQGAEKYKIFRKTLTTSWKEVGTTTATNFLDITAISGNTYTYTVRCITSDEKIYTSGYDADGMSIYYIETPKVITVKSHEEGIRVVWNKVSGAERYRLFRKTENTSWITIGDTTTNEFIDTTAESGNVYTYTVRCVNSDGSAYTSAYDSVGKSIAYLAIPQLSNVGLHVDGVKVTWKKVTGAEKYRIFRKTASTGWVTLADVTTNSYIDTSVKSGTTYSYTIRCVSSDGNTYTSDYDRIGKSVKYIAAPKVSTLNVNLNGVKINWNAVSGAENYRVFRKTASSSWVALTDTTSTDYTDTTAQAGITYIYTIRCISSDGKTFTSAYDTQGKSISILNSPEISSISKVSTGVKINWNVTGAEQYRVYRLQANGTWKKVADVTTNTFIDTSVVSGNTYTYTIRCMNADGSYTSAYDTKGVSVSY